MSSKLLEPIKNVLQQAQFYGNTKINSFGSWESSLEKLMNLIDNECDTPFEEQQHRKAKIATEVVESLRASRRFSDFTIVVGSKEFAVHKSVLGIQSSVFAAIFENDMKERIEGKMEIEEFSAAAVEDFLRFFYTGEIQDARNAMEIFELAAKYDILKLKLIAEIIVFRQVEENNAMQILELANLYKSENLKNKAFTEIKKMFPKTALQPELKDKPDDVKELIEAKRNFEENISEAEKEQQQMMKEAQEKAQKKKEEAEKEQKQVMKEAGEKAQKKMEKANEEFEMKMQKYNKNE
jgi:BTB/POZ domain